MAIKQEVTVLLYDMSQNLSNEDKKTLYRLRKDTGYFKYLSPEERGIIYLLSDDQREALTAIRNSGLNLNYLERKAAIILHDILTGKKNWLKETESEIDDAKRMLNRMKKEES